jgi:hypothetical protein
MIPEPRIEAISAMRSLIDDYRDSNLALSRGTVQSPGLKADQEGKMRISMTIVRAAAALVLTPPAARAQVLTVVEVNAPPSIACSTRVVPWS